MAGTITFAQDATGPVGRIIATCTADVADGSFPATALPRFSGHLLALQTNPGATAPTDNWDLTLVDDAGLDRLAGVGANRDTATSERAAIPGSPGVGMTETLTLTPTGNSVNSAVVVVTFFYAAVGAPEALLPAALGGSGGLKVEQVGTFTVDTELPAAVALSDTLANPTVPGVGAYLVGWDGTQWVRLPTNSAAQANILRVALFTGTGDQVVGTNHTEDGVTAATSLFRVQTWPMAFNGTTEDRLRNNVKATLLASAARTATTNSSDQTNQNGRGCRVFLDVTVASGTGGLTLKIQAKDPASGSYVDLLVSTSFITTGLRAFVVYPGVTVVANQSSSDILDRDWRVRVEAADGSSYTYSVGSVVVL